MQFKKSSLYLAITALAGIGAFAQPALATDSHVYPGALCQAQQGQLETHLSHFNVTSNGLRSSSTRVRVSCPILRDSVGGTRGIRAIINVSRSSNLNPGPLFCRASALRKDGTTLTTRSFSFSGLGNREFVLDVRPGFSGGPYNIMCDLPYLSSVNSYYIEEL